MPSSSVATASSASSSGSGSERARRRAAAQPGSDAYDFGMLWRQGKNISDFRVVVHLSCGVHEQLASGSKTHPQAMYDYLKASTPP